MPYQAPVDDIVFALQTVRQFSGDPGDTPDCDLDEDTFRAILEEAGRFAADILEPLNAPGDRHGAKLTNGKVELLEGWHDAYAQFCEAGWNALPCAEQYGGQALPSVVSMAACEIWNAANLSFGQCPLLTQGAIDALEIGASDDLKALYLPKLVSGEWSGTMNLTEPQAGSDLSAVRTRAEPQGDGTYRIFGTKIFITYGDHELTKNIVHLVLARLPGAPEGTHGISLFLVPKFLPDAKGAPGERNDVVCAGLEHKMGIHAGPTCVMSFGENEGAVGWLVGEENRGLNTMFIMMNAARLAVGMQGVAIAERATQRALSYAHERIQGRDAAKSKSGGAPIIAHPDVRRMLLRMQALTQAARAICLATAAETDRAHHGSTQAERETAADRVALLTPVAKAFSTDAGCEVASLGVQVHGGTGYIEDSGAAQNYRDVRILPIYEGTNGIQAMDLVMRKLPLSDGQVLRTYLNDLTRAVEKIQANNTPAFGSMPARLDEALKALTETSQWLRNALAKNPEDALAGASAYLRLFGLTAGGVYLATGALRALAGDQPAPNDERQIALARFFGEHLAVEAPALARSITEGAGSVLAVPPNMQPSTN